MKYTFTFLILFFIPTAWAQEESRKELRGKITSDAANLDGVNIVNRNTEQSVETHTGGYFAIRAKEGDTLMFASVRFKGRQVKVGKEGFDGSLLLVNLESMIQLDEVVLVKYDHINARDMGIIPRDTKKYTVAERRLRTAGGSQNQYGTNSQISLDGIVNGLSGKTARLRKELEVEKKETLLQKLEDLYEESYFTDYLKIPADYVKGFQYYIVENQRLKIALDARNKTMASFLMAELAVRYKDTIQCEQQ